MRGDGHGGGVCMFAVEADGNSKPRWKRGVEKALLLHSAAVAALGAQASKTLTFKEHGAHAKAKRDASRGITCHGANGPCRGGR